MQNLKPLESLLDKKIMEKRQAFHSLRAMQRAMEEKLREESQTYRELEDVRNRLRLVMLDIRQAEALREMTEGE